MKATAISATMPLPHLVEQGITTPEELLVYVARVSNPQNQLNTETETGLIKYCIKNRHWSVFETNCLTVEVEVPRDIGRQILRHRSFQFQELSQRYTDPRQSVGFTVREARLQDNKNRQNSIYTDDESLKSLWEQIQGDVINEADRAYQWAIDNGIAKECARVVLPEGNTMSRMYITSNLRNFITYIALREKSGTQAEHMQIAKMIKGEICKLFPVVAAALGDVDTPWVL